MPPKRPKPKAKKPPPKKLDEVVLRAAKACAKASLGKGAAKQSEMVRHLMYYYNDGKSNITSLVRLPKILLHSTNVTAVTFRHHYFVNIIFPGDIVIPDAYVEAAYKFALDQIRLELEDIQKRRDSPTPMPPSPYAQKYEQEESQEAGERFETYRVMNKVLVYQCRENVRPNPVFFDGQQPSVPKATKGPRTEPLPPPPSPTSPVAGTSKRTDVLAAKREKKRRKSLQKMREKRARESEEKALVRKSPIGFMKTQSRLLQVIFGLVRARLKTHEWPGLYQSFTPEKEIELLVDAIDGMQATSRQQVYKGPKLGSPGRGNFHGQKLGGEPYSAFLVDPPFVPSEVSEANDKLTTVPCCFEGLSEQQAKDAADAALTLFGGGGGGGQASDEEDEEAEKEPPKKKRKRLTKKEKMAQETDAELAKIALDDKRQRKAVLELLDPDELQELSKQADDHIATYLAASSRPLDESVVPETQYPPETQAAEGGGDPSASEAASFMAERRANKESSTESDADDAAEQEAAEEDASEEEVEEEEEVDFATRQQRERDRNSAYTALLMEKLQLADLAKGMEPADKSKKKLRKKAQKLARREEKLKEAITPRDMPRRGAKTSAKEKIAAVAASLSGQGGGDEEDLSMQRDMFEDTSGDRPTSAGSFIAITENVPGGYMAVVPAGGVIPDDGDERETPQGAGGARGDDDKTPQGEEAAEGAPAEGAAAEEAAAEEAAAEEAAAEEAAAEGEEVEGEETAEGEEVAEREEVEEEVVEDEQTSEGPLVIAGLSQGLSQEDAGGGSGGEQATSETTAAGPTVETPAAESHAADAPPSTDE